MNSHFVHWSVITRFLVIGSLLASPLQATPSYNYQVQEGDVLNIDIALRGSLGDLSRLSGLPLDIVGESIFSHHTLTVTPDGLIFLPGISSTKVTGMTLSQIENVIASSLHLPTDRNYVSVALVRTNTLALYVWGEVKQPGKYLLDHPTSLMEAISQAGGPTDRARIRSVIIIRSGEKALKVNLSMKYLREHGPSEVMLRPYDTIYVPKTWSVSEFLIYGLLTAIGTASSVYVASKAR